MGPFPVQVGTGIDFDLTASRLHLPEPEVGNPAPDFALLAADGTTVQLTFLRGRPVVVSFFCHCALCDALATALSKRAEIAQRARLLAVSTDPEMVSPALIEVFRQKTGFTGLMLNDS